MMLHLKAIRDVTVDLVLVPIADRGHIVSCLIL